MPLGATHQLFATFHSAHHMTELLALPEGYEYTKVDYTIVSWVRKG